MNPVDNPHGGGEKNSGGIFLKGARKNKRTDKMILSR